MVAEPFSVAFLALALNPRRNDHNRPAKERTASTHNNEKGYVVHAPIIMCSQGSRNFCSIANVGLGAGAVDGPNHVNPYVRFAVLGFGLAFGF